MNETATVNIPKDVLEPIVRSQVAAGIVKALGDPARIIEQVVQLALTQKVTANGVVSGYSYENTHNFVEVMAKNAIHAVVREMLAQWVEEQKPTIQEHVEKALGRQKSAFAKALVGGLCDSVKSAWSFKCDVTLKGN